MKIKQNITRS